MNAEKLLAAVQAVEIPEDLDLTTDELNVIKADAAEPFDLIHLAFQCGFMRGQGNAATDRAIDRLELAEFTATVRTIHSMVLALACALDGITENGCEPAQFVPALHSVEDDLDKLETRMKAALEQEG